MRNPTNWLSCSATILVSVKCWKNSRGSSGARYTGPWGSGWGVGRVLDDVSGTAQDLGRLVPVFGLDEDQVSVEG